MITFARSLSLATAGALGAAVLAAVPAAQAAAPTPFYESEVYAYAWAYDNDCAPDDGDSSSVSERKDAPGGNGVASARRSRTSTAAGDATDTTTMNAASTATLKTTAVGGYFSTMTLTTNLNLVTSRALGDVSSCSPQASGEGSGRVQVYLPTSGTLTLTLDQPLARVEAEAGITGYTDGTFDRSTWGTYLYVEDAQRTTSTWVPAGYYRISSYAYGSARTPASEWSPTSLTGPVTSRVGFTPDAPKATAPKGVATGKAKGKAKKLVKLPNTVSCASNTAVATWTKRAKKLKKAKKAGQARRANFTVGKKKVAVVKKVKPNKKVTLKRLPKGPITITAKVKLRNGKTLKAKRSYSAC